MEVNPVDFGRLIAESEALRRDLRDFIATQHENNQALMEKIDLFETRLDGIENSKAKVLGGLGVLSFLGGLGGGSAIKWLSGDHH